MGREQAGKFFVGSLHVWIRLDAARCPQVQYFLRVTDPPTSLTLPCMKGKSLRGVNNFHGEWDGIGNSLRNTCRAYAAQSYRIVARNAQGGLQGGVGLGRRKQECPGEEEARGTVGQGTTAQHNRGTLDVV